jgi:hypothetical protein
MINNEAVILPDAENKQPENRVWGAWATVGFGAAVLAVFVVVQVLVVIIAGVAMAFTQLQLTSGTPQFDIVLNKISDVLNANMGLLQSIATIASGIICTGLILLFIKARKRAGIAEYLGLKKINYTAALLALGVVGVFIVLSSLVYYTLGKSTNERIVNDLSYRRVGAVILDSRGHLRPVI